MDRPCHEDNLPHYWARRRDGRVCIHCGTVEFGKQAPIRDEYGVVLVRSEE